jgi:hypothetical protein
MRISTPPRFSVTQAKEDTTSFSFETSHFSGCSFPGAVLNSAENSWWIQTWQLIFTRVHLTDISKNLEQSHESKAVQNSTKSPTPYCWGYVRWIRYTMIMNDKGKARLMFKFVVSKYSSFKQFVGTLIYLHAILFDVGRSYVNFVSLTTYLLLLWYRRHLI